jgi:serine/arginine repetitive matrix protein 2
MLLDRSRDDPTPHILGPDNVQSLFSTVMYNGIGLTTPRGRYVFLLLSTQKCFFKLVAISGTNGYVVRNLSVLRSHDTQHDRANAWDAAPPKHREPDKEILEHERKRKVEVKCLELQLELEDKE